MEWASDGNDKQKKKTQALTYHRGNASEQNKESPSIWMSRRDERDEIKMDEMERQPTKVGCLCQIVYCLAMNLGCWIEKCMSFTCHRLPNAGANVFTHSHFKHENVMLIFFPRKPLSLSVCVLLLPGTQFRCHSCILYANIRVWLSWAIESNEGK